MFNIPQEIIEKYSVSGPRYTSYPTAPMWKPITPDIQLDWYKDAQLKNDRPLSLYFHIPFCWQRCYYCGCNTVVSSNPADGAGYVAYLLRELEKLAKIIPSGKKLIQMHFGGGTPTFLQNKEFAQIVKNVLKYFPLGSNPELGIEVDPRTVEKEKINFLAELGFNRISMGVQDFDPVVQKTINRVQSEETTFALLQHARSLNFKGINFDLIYGLPNQTLDTFSRTIDKVIEMRPDRLAVYNYAHVPAHNPNQNRFLPETLPDSPTKLKILFKTIDKFCASGYEYIGMDHFATPEDELSLALKNRTLHRNFMGYTTRAGCDLYGIGVSAISEFGRYFTQNEKGIPEYKDLINSFGLTGKRGIMLNMDDQKRKWVILRIMCHFYLSFQDYQNEFKESFQDYFQDELEKLKDLENDGLLKIQADSLKVTENGKIMVRNICMEFDAYLHRENAPAVQYSKTI